MFEELGHDKEIKLACPISEESKQNLRLRWVKSQKIIYTGLALDFLC